MAVGSEKEKEMWKKLTYETVGDMSGQKGEHMDFVDSKKDATTQQLPGEEGEKRENIVMHPTGNVANDGNSANKGAKRGVKFHRKERKGKKGDNTVLGVTVGGKRAGDAMECDVMTGGEAKRSKYEANETQNISAGQSERLCEHQ